MSHQLSAPLPIITDSDWSAGSAGAVTRAVTKCLAPCLQKQKQMMKRPMRGRIAHTLSQDREGITICPSTTNINYDLTHNLNVP